MKIKIFLLTSLLFVSSLTQAEVLSKRTYNECTKVGDSKSGIYFENGWRVPSVNSSEHFYESIYVVVGDQRQEFRFVGEQTDPPDYYEVPGSPKVRSNNLSNTSYVAFQGTFKGGSVGKSSLMVTFDLSHGSPNGKVSGIFDQGQAFSFDLNCR